MAYTKIDPNDRAAVLWLQMAMAEIMPGPGSVARVGIFDGLTQKSVRIYQLSRKLPLTGVPDELTLQKINQEIQERGLTI